MYIVYFYNRSGMYQTSIYIERVTKAVQVAFRYSHIVRKIMMTERDMSSLEIVDGEVVFPEEMRADSKELAERFGKSTFGELR